MSIPRPMSPKLYAPGEIPTYENAAARAQWERDQCYAVRPEEQFELALRFQDQKRAWRLSREQFECKTSNCEVLTSHARGQLFNRTFANKSWTLEHMRLRKDPSWDLEGQNREQRPMPINLNLEIKEEMEANAMEADSVRAPARGSPDEMPVLDREDPSMEDVMAPAASRHPRKQAVPHHIPQDPSEPAPQPAPRLTGTALLLQQVQGFDMKSQEDPRKTTVHPRHFLFDERGNEIKKTGEPLTDACRKESCRDLEEKLPDSCLLVNRPELQVTFTQGGTSKGDLDYQVTRKDEVPMKPTEAMPYGAMFGRRNLKILYSKMHGEDSDDDDEEREAREEEAHREAELERMAARAPSNEPSSPSPQQDTNSRVMELLVSAKSQIDRSAGTIQSSEASASREAMETQRRNAEQIHLEQVRRSQMEAKLREEEEARIREIASKKEAEDLKRQAAELRQLDQERADRKRQQLLEAQRAQEQAELLAEQLAADEAAMEQAPEPVQEEPSTSTPKSAQEKDAKSKEAEQFSAHVLGIMNEQQSLIDQESREGTSSKKTPKKKEQKSSPATPASDSAANTRPTRSSAAQDTADPPSTTPSTSDATPNRRSRRSEQSEGEQSAKSVKKNEENPLSRSARKARRDEEEDQGEPSGRRSATPGSKKKRLTEADRLLGMDFGPKEGGTLAELHISYTRRTRTSVPSTPKSPPPKRSTRRSGRQSVSYRNEEREEEEVESDKEEAPEVQRPKTPKVAAPQEPKEDPAPVAKLPTPPPPPIQLPAPPTPPVQAPPAPPAPIAPPQVVQAPSPPKKITAVMFPLATPPSAQPSTSQPRLAPIAPAPPATLYPVRHMTPPARRLPTGEPLVADFVKIPDIRNQVLADKRKEEEEIRLLQEERRRQRQQQIQAGAPNQHQMQMQRELQRIQQNQMQQVHGLHQPQMMPRPPVVAQNAPMIHAPMPPPPIHPGPIVPAQATPSPVPNSPKVPENDIFPVDFSHGDLRTDLFPLPTHISSVKEPKEPVFEGNEHLMINVLEVPVPSGANLLYDRWNIDQMTEWIRKVVGPCREADVQVLREREVDGPVLDLFHTSDADTIFAGVSVMSVLKLKRAAATLLKALVLARYNHELAIWKHVRDLKK